MNRRIFVLLLAGVSAFAVAPAWAQSAPAPTAKELDTIVVTARRRTESLQNVPVAVNAISSVQLQNHLSTDLATVVELAPQVLIGRNGSGTGSILTIRGISTAPTDAGLDQSVAVAVDGVIMSRGRIISARMYDTKQVEVLQGPQALFFGKNSPAGVISISTNDPTSSFEGSATAGYEFNASEKYFEGYVSGPITDTLKARLAFRSEWIKGWIDNRATPITYPFIPNVTTPGATMGSRGPAGDSFSARMTLQWTPSEDFDARLKLTYDELHQNSMAAYIEFFCTGGRTVPVINGVAMPTADCNKDQSTSVTSIAPQFTVNGIHQNNGVPYLTSKFTLGSLTLNKKLDHVTLTATTGYYRQQHRGTYGDYGPFGVLYTLQQEAYTLVSQEVRANTEFAGPVNAMVGAYYEHSHRPWLNAPELLHAGLNPAGSYATTVTTANSKGTSYSLFAELRWNILPNLELAGGARYSHDHKTDTFVNLLNNPFSFYALRPVGQAIHPRFSGSNVSPAVTLSWHPQTDQMVYVAYKTGYKAGGISNNAILLTSATETNVQFGKEEVRGFEGGFKSYLLEHRLRLNATAYRYKYKGLQVATFNAQTISFTIGNAASARTQGVQADFVYAATDVLSFNGAIGYNDAKYLKFPNSACYGGQTAAQGCIAGKQDLSGHRLVRAPKVMGNFGAEYDTRVSDNWRATFSVDASFSSGYMAQADYSPGGYQKSYWRLNASAHLKSNDDKYDLAVIGRDLNDAWYMTQSVSYPFGTTDEYIGTFQRPLEIAVQATVRF
jgi:outer membrane receptor protein involved in Fe transport